MALAGVIYQPKPNPNPVGEALVQGSKTIMDSQVQAATLKRSQDEKLVTMAMTFLPKLANNPQMLSQFTSHPDFSKILGAFENVGLRNVFSYDPGSGSYTVNIPPDIPSMEEAYQQQLSKRYSPGSPDWMKGILDYRRANPYESAFAKQQANAALQTPEEQAQIQERQARARALGDKAYGEALTDPATATEARATVGQLPLPQDYEYGGIFGIGKKKAHTVGEIPKDVVKDNKRMEKVFPNYKQRLDQEKQTIAKRRRDYIAKGE